MLVFVSCPSDGVVGCATYDDVVIGRAPLEQAAWIDVCDGLNAGFNAVRWSLNDEFVQGHDEVSNLYHSLSPEVSILDYATTGLSSHLWVIMLYLPIERFAMLGVPSDAIVDAPSVLVTRTLTAETIATVFWASAFGFRTFGSLYATIKYDKSFRDP